MEKIKWPDYQIFVKDITETRFGLGIWISPKDIRQGELGDCYFLSTLSSIDCRWLIKSLLNLGKEYMWSCCCKTLHRGNVESNNIR